MAMKWKILVADDDPIMRELLRVLLTKAGYDVIFAEDGQSAVEMAISEKPDLVLSDGLLPKIHGFLVCQAIKQFCNPPKVILLTGIYTKPAYKWEAKIIYGADDWLTKPFNAATLLDCIEKHLSDLPLKEAIA